MTTAPDEPPGAGVPQDPLLVLVVVDGPGSPELELEDEPDEQVLASPPLEVPESAPPEVVSIGGTTGPDRNVFRHLAPYCPTMAALLIGYVGPLRALPSWRSSAPGGEIIPTRALTMPPAPSMMVSGACPRLRGRVRLTRFSVAACRRSTHWGHRSAPWISYTRPTVHPRSCTPDPNRCRSRPGSTACLVSRAPVPGSQRRVGRRRERTRASSTAHANTHRPTRWTCSLARLRPNG